ncbi:MAG: hypothetical protein WCX28_01300 [Bacteriovoracaceae bacterium]
MVSVFIIVHSIKICISREKIPGPVDGAGQKRFTATDAGAFLRASA